MNCLGHLRGERQALCKSSSCTGPLVSNLKALHPVRCAHRPLLASDRLLLCVHACNRAYLCRHQRATSVQPAAALQPSQSSSTQASAAQPFRRSNRSRGRTVIVRAAKDYYDILGVSKTADKKQIKQAYRQKARKFHPVSDVRAVNYYASSVGAETLTAVVYFSLSLAVLPHASLWLPVVIQPAYACMEGNHHRQVEDMLSTTPRQRCSVHSHLCSAISACTHAWLAMLCAAVALCMSPTSAQLWPCQAAQCTNDMLPTRIHTTESQWLAALQLPHIPCTKAVAGITLVRKHATLQQ